MDENDELIVEAAKALGLSELVPQLYRDALQAATRELGQGLLDRKPRIRSV